MRKIREGETYEEWLEARRAYQREWRAANRDKVLEHQRNWTARNGDKIKEWDRLYYERTGEYLRSYYRLQHRNDPRRQILMHAKKRSKQKDIPFSITIDDIIVPNYCPVLGIPIEIGNGQQVDGSPTLDRIVPELGYISGNVAVISWRANRLKSNATADELEAIAKWMRGLTPSSDYDGME